MTEKRETLIIEVLLSIIILLLIISLADRFQLERRQAQQRKELDERSKIGVILIDAMQRNNLLTEDEKRRLIQLRKEAGYPQ